MSRPDIDPNLISMSREELLDTANDLAHLVHAQDDQIERLQAALHKADRWGVDVIADLVENDIIKQDDML